MGTKRTGMTEKGAREYRLANGNYAKRMGDGFWYVFTHAGADTGRDYTTLKAAQAANQKGE